MTGKYTDKVGEKLGSLASYASGGNTVRQISYSAPQIILAILAKYMTNNEVPLAVKMGVWVGCLAAGIAILYERDKQKKVGTLESLILGSASSWVA